MGKFPVAVQNIKRNKDLNHECKIFNEPKFASLTQPTFSHSSLFFTFVLSMSALLVLYFCFVKTFMKIQSKGHEQKKTLSEMLSNKDNNSWAGGCILNYKQLDFDWNLIPLRVDQNIEPSTCTPLWADPHTWYLPEIYINAIRRKWLNTKKSKLHHYLMETV